jgi:hypothetical protein
VQHNGTGVVYLLHFDRPFGHARHYTGWVTTRTYLLPRLGAHTDGVGARLMQVIAEAGIGFRLARTWDGGRTRERQLKRQGGASRRCPICKAPTLAQLARLTLDQPSGDQVLADLELGAGVGFDEVYQDQDGELSVAGGPWWPA